VFALEQVRARCLRAGLVLALFAACGKPPPVEEPASEPDEPVTPVSPSSPSSPSPASPMSPSQLSLAFSKVELPEPPKLAAVETAEEFDARERLDKEPVNERADDDRTERGSHAQQPATARLAIVEIAASGTGATLRLQTQPGVAVGMRGTAYDQKNVKVALCTIAKVDKLATCTVDVPIDRAKTIVNVVVTLRKP
jgi:hypothetical protein